MPCSQETISVLRHEDRPVCSDWDFKLFSFSFIQSFLNWNLEQSFLSNKTKVMIQYLEVRNNPTSILPRGCLVSFFFLQSIILWDYFAE